MDSAVIGLAGVVAGLVVGNGGKYFGQRRDAWREARAAGLIVLADMRALRSAPQGARLATAHTLVETWAAKREVLASFRRGNYPNGFKAEEWVKVAGALGRLEASLLTATEVGLAPAGASSDADPVLEETSAPHWWVEVERHLRRSEKILSDFEHDPGVVWHNIRAGVSRRFRRTRWRPDPCDLSVEE